MAKPKRAPLPLPPPPVGELLSADPPLGDLPEDPPDPAADDALTDLLPGTLPDPPPREPPTWLEECDLELPLLLGGAISGYAATRLDLGRLSPPQAAALRRLVLGLNAARETFVSRGGQARPVKNGADAIRWLLDRVAATIASAGPSA